MPSGLPVVEFTGGYTGEPEEYDPGMDLKEGTVWGAKIGTMRLGPKNPRPFDPEAEVLRDYMVESIKQYAVPGEPYFGFGRAPSESGIEIFSLLANVQRMLERDPSMTRKLYFVRPFDLVATYRAYREGRIDERLPDAMSELRGKIESAAPDAGESLLLEAAEKETGGPQLKVWAEAVQQGKVTGTSAIPVLVARLGEKTAGGVEALLAAMGERAQPALCEALEEPDTRLAAVRSLAGMETLTKETRQALLGRLSTAEDPAEQVALMEALHRRDKLAVEPPLAGRLVEWSGPETVETLEKRRLAVRMIGRLQDRAQAIDLLMKLLDEEDAFTAAAAAQTLGQMGPDAADALPKLTELLTQRQYDRYTKVAAIEALPAIDPTGAQSVDALTRQLRERELTRLAAVRSLTLIAGNARSAMPEIAEHVTTHVWRTVRLAGLEAMLVIDPTSALTRETLQRMARGDLAISNRERAKQALATAEKTSTP